MGHTVHWNLFNLSAVGNCLEAEVLVMQRRYARETDMGILLITRSGALYRLPGANSTPLALVAKVALFVLVSERQYATCTSGMSGAIFKYFHINSSGKV